MRIAIATPTGNIGSKIVDRLLREEEHELVLLARKPESLAEAESKGARIEQGDLENGEYVRRATKRVHALFWVIPPKMHEADFSFYARKVAENAAAAIRENSIDRVVFLSSIGAHLGDGLGPISSLHDAERILRRAAWNLTILRPAFFMENILMSLQGIAESSSVFLPVSSDVSIPMVATKDVAYLAARVLTDETWKGLHIAPIHGPRDYSFGEAAHIAGRIVGHEVRHVRITEDQTRQHLLGLGASENVTGLFLEMYSAMEKCTIRPEFPRRKETTTPTTLEEFAEEVIVPALANLQAVK